MKQFNVNLRGRIGNTGVLECWSNGVLEDAKEQKPRVSEIKSLE